MVSWPYANVAASDSFHEKKVNVTVTFHIYDNAYEEESTLNCDQFKGKDYLPDDYYCEKLSTSGLPMGMVSWGLQLNLIAVTVLVLVF